MPTILVVEDDKGIQNYLRELLLDNGFHVNTASDGIEALASVEKVEPDLVILDLGLPSLSGADVCSRIKKNHPALPVVIVTARDTSSDVVKGFGIGADDYVTKPFIGDELLARINARLRQPGGDELVLKVADLTLDRKALEVKRSNKLIELTPKEFKLLEYLMHNKGRILTREMILNRIWLYSSDIETRVVDVYIGYLRKKIDSGFSHPLIRSSRGFGYSIKE